MAGNKTFMIAEVAQAHDGSLGILHSYIDALADTGVDAIKFQTHIADAESSIYEPFRINFSYVDKTRKDYWARMGFSFEQWKEIKSHCDEAGVEFISSPFSIAAVELLEELGVKRYKIGSGEVNNLLMLQLISETGKDIILSSGMSSLSELDRTVDFLSSSAGSLSLLQCTTQYPTKPEEIGLNVMTEMRERYCCPVGLSDHSGTIYPSLAASAQGADILEFHAVFDRRMFGPDSTSSLTINEVAQLVQGVRCINTISANPVDKSKDYIGKNKSIFGKSLAVNRQVRAGDIITRDMLETKKPADKGISASDYGNVIGRTVRRELQCWEFLNWDDLND